MTGKIANILAFQAGWFIAVVGAAQGHPWAGPLYAVGWLTMHVGRRGADRRAEVAVLLCAALLGYAADSLLVVTNIMAFPESAQLGGPTTLWMVSLWVMFAATLRHGLSWLRGHYRLAALLGAVGGPLAYWAGARLGAINLAEVPSSYLLVAAEWALAVPLLLAMASRAELGTAVTMRETMVDQNR